ncbi:protein TIME FOR COFFEE [Dorcoceras hygrometricum]|uniref:Protein TIME FOR COFFEE n=1 Tax=Dorcoceras hygrometricum TaxID=472368 RepID=A0A2Z7D118_9LAMI|nr:protein TIME FOR COFFEE [Dorcoceras hygrometricum]
MDRNREARRASIVGSNGFKRRRHRTNSLRGSPDEDLGVELQESIRLRDRVRNDRDRERERERERERGRDLRERDSRSKRRRAERLMINRDDVGGDETSEESVNDEEEEEDEENTAAAGGVRMLPPAVSNHHHHHHNHHHSHSSSLSQQHDSSASNIIAANHHLQTRKTFPPSTSSSSSKVFKAGPVWKPGDEMIGVSVPRKARSASAKRSHDRISGSSNNNISAGGVVGAEQIHRQASSSPVRQGLASTSAAAPVSPSSSNASVRKKLKLNSGPKLKPPKVSSKTTSSNPEELEIEIAEVLYGLKTQSQSPSLKKDDSREVNRSSSDTKSHVSSPISNSTSANNLNLASNSSPLSVVAPKRKRPRQVLENSSYHARGSPVSAKAEMDQAPKSESSSPKMEKISGSTAENNGDLANYQVQELHLLELKAPESIKMESEFKSTAEESKNNNADLVPHDKISLIKGKEMRTDDSGREESTLTATASAAVTIIKASLHSSEAENREEKFVIDLMAPPPLVRSSPEKETKVDLAGSDQKPDLSMVDTELKSLMLKDKEEEKGKGGKVQLTNATGEETKSEKIAEGDELLKPFESKGRNLDLHLHFEKSERDGGSKLQQQVSKQPQMPLKVAKEEPANGKPGQLASSLPLPMSMATWPGGLPPPPMGYMAPLQGVVSMDGSTVTPAPVQPPFSQPRPKRCATHCYIARNINCFQQFMKMNPFWQAAAGSASLFGPKPGNMNAVTVTDLLGNNAVRGPINNVQDKGQNLASISSPGGKEKNSQSANSSDSAHRKQQIMLQQALPPVATPSNLVGPAFIFPLNQQQAVAAAAAAAASVRPAVAKSHTAASQASSNASRSASASAPATAGGTSTPVSFNYPNMATNETQYLAILQNNAYPFPIPAVGAPPNYRGPPTQAMPLFNGPFYSSQMIHPSQLQHQQPATSQSPQLQQAHQNASASTGSSSSQKHLPGQQIRAPSGSTSGVAGSTNFPAQKPQPSQQMQQAHNQHLPSARPRLVDNEIGIEESPSTNDNRGSWASVNIYGQNFAMPIHPQNFALMTPPPVLASAAAPSVVPVGAVNSSEKKPSQQTQQQKSKGGVDSIPPHSFAMSFGTMNGSNASPGIDISSMTQNHAVFQNFPESTRQNIQMVAAVAAAQAAQKKNFRISEDVKSGGGDSASSDAERKNSSGKVGMAQSIAFTRSDLADTPVSSIPTNSGIDSSARPLNVSTGSGRSSRPGTANSAGVGNVQNAHIQVQLQQQQMLQINKQHQLLAATRKAPTTSNGNVYSDHLNSSSSVSAKFPNPLPVEKSYKNSHLSSAVSSRLIDRSNTQKPSSAAFSGSTAMHTQISFGGNQKTLTGAQGQTPINSNQAPSPPMMVSSPTTSSISKGSSGSPRTTTAVPSSNKMNQASSLSAQPLKNPVSIPSQKSPSILGNPQIASSPSSGAKPHIQQQPHQQQPHQQQLPKNMQQGQLFFSNPFSQVQATNPTNTSSTTSVPSGYYMPRRRSEQPNQPAQQPPNVPPTSTGAVSLTTPATSTTATNDPAKAIAAATCNVKSGGLTSQGVIHAAQLAAQSAGALLPVGFSYAHPVPAAVPTKPSEHKQSAG